MALFKISRGNEANLPTNHNDGYAYFTQDTHNFYIDHEGTEKDENGNPIIIRSLSGPGKNTTEHGTIFNDLEGNWVDGAYSTAIGQKVQVGLKAYRIKSIDITNKKIYLSNSEDIITPVISTENNLDTNFITPEYEINDEFSLIVRTSEGRSHRHFVSTIKTIQNNVIEYTTDLPFSNLVYDSDAHSNVFFVPSKPQIGIVSMSNSSFGEGLENIVAGSYAHVEGYGNIAAGNFGHAEGRETKSGYAAHAEGMRNIASHNYSHAEGSMTTASGNSSHAEGSNTIAKGNSSHAEGMYSIASGDYGAHAEGKQTLASGINGSHSEGYNTKAYGDEGSHSEGYYTEAHGIHGSHSEGHLAKATGDYGSHAEGYSTTATGDKGAHAEGINSHASGVEGAHAEGAHTKASGNYGIHAEGFFTEAGGQYGSHAEGHYSKALGEYGAHAEGNHSEVHGHYGSHAEGHFTEVHGNYGAHAEGYNVIVNGSYGAHAEGMNTVAGSNIQHVEGKFNLIDNNNKYAHIVGNGEDDDHRSNAYALDWWGNGEFKNSVKAPLIYADQELYIKGNLAIDTNTLKNYTTTRLQNTKYSGVRSIYAKEEGTDYFVGSNAFALGFNSKASGSSSFTIGADTVASGYCSYASGFNTVASNDYSHAEGVNTEASGQNGAHAEGNGTEASGQNGAHAEGYNTKARGFAAHAEGYNSEAIGTSAHAEGTSAFAKHHYTHAEGQGTVTNGLHQHVQGKFNDYTSDSSKNMAHIVGGGSSDTDRNNIHTLDWSGNAWFSGNVTVGEDKKQLATQEYVDNLISTRIDEFYSAILEGKW